MTRRTDSANGASCALVLTEILARLDTTPFASTMIAARPELAHAVEAAKAALAGAELVRVRCLAPSCAWRGIFPLAGAKFRCVRCGSLDGQPVRS